jgi:hypothetical protein
LYRHMNRFEDMVVKNDEEDIPISDELEFRNRF